ncbi:MAG: hypothetical protein CO016_00805 [Candidatus Yonathbacteria bacterium CG_4_8_14_3_um_filter_46_25]|uniref:Response regulatory domain-containing protein n=2 Tax=Parcubacteria group TaxID=1794811 RepID=A0A1J4VA55_9BACT|nr:MAG: hypothetical protein AUJ44_01315 [Candidatus Nomurabacteria bacterium CG1_02_47_685]PIP03482.1 MAG: hypothetical protein COX54_03520 [Candidatus Yonathbacteria bacterium CG23_combo_of_CG06-09_8_20_14_all_46_18]PJC67646.1 MAG: hypothetical protein CO016_00805 [Candidatus Yonathbacteria bacterium CG_4_8_14_3_um_filter_46_25]
MTQKKILVVEDDSVLRDVLMEKLKKSGYAVKGAFDGQEAIEVMPEYAPDLVLLDILMPRKDGMEVLEEMSKDEKLHKIPVIVVSNSGQPVEIERARELGARDFLVKAVFDPGEVMGKIEKVLGSGTQNENSHAEKKEAKAVGGTRNTYSKKPIGAAHGSASSNDKEPILVVEDDKFLRDLLVGKLFNEGFEVKSAIDSRGALDILHNANGWKPRVVLLDLILPGEDGFSVLVKIKNDENLAAIPVIILSNLGQKEDIDKAIELGAYDFMVKANFTLDEILEKVKSVLNN